MPAYNAGRFIAESINSVQSQSYGDWELIVIDDGSSDDTYRIARDLSKQDKRIKVFRQENGGPARARNNGIKEASGDAIAFLDADDLWLPNKLEQQVTFLENNPQVALLFSHAIVVGPDGREEGLIKCGVGEFSGLSGQHMLLKENQINTLTVICRSEVFDKVGLFNEKFSLAEDYHLWIRILMEGYMLFGLNLRTACYRMHNSSLSAKDRTLYLPSIDILEDLKGRYSKFAEEIDKAIKFKFWLELYHRPHITKNSLNAFLKKYIECYGSRINVKAINLFFMLFGGNLTRRLLLVYLGIYRFKAYFQN